MHSEAAQGIIAFRFFDMASDAALLSLAEKSSLLFFVYDKTTDRFIYVNEAFSVFFGLESQTINPVELMKIVHADDRDYLMRHFEGLTESKPSTELECRFVRGANQRALRINAYLANENGENQIMGHAQDISTFKANTEILSEHNNKKHSILNILTHDLAGPIGTIGNLSELIRRATAGQNLINVPKYLDSIKKITEGCIRLIRDFLNQEFLESSGVQLLKRRVNLARKIRIAAEEYQGMQKELGIHFDCNISNEPLYANIDEDKFLQVINNLVSNALKFTPDGGTITIDLAEEEDEIILSVKDTGIGIPEKYHAKLFDKFSEARRNGLHGEHSTGLGMSIIKTIVEWHNGRVWFESEENKGTTFYISIPKT